MVGEDWGHPDFSIPWNCFQIAVIGKYIFQKDAWIKHLYKLIKTTFQKSYTQNTLNFKVNITEIFESDEYQNLIFNEIPSSKSLIF